MNQQQWTEWRESEATQAYLRCLEDLINEHTYVLANGSLMSSKDTAKDYAWTAGVIAGLRRAADYNPKEEA